VLQRFEVADLLPPYQNNHLTSWKEYEVNVKNELTKSVPKLESASERVTRERVIRLAIAYNQATIILCCRTVPNDLLARADRLCDHFKMKGLATAGRWTLERKLDKALSSGANFHCCRCGRALTNRVSVNVGMGPTCRHKNGKSLGNQASLGRGKS
jgi:hypothetical protein